MKPPQLNHIIQAYATFMTTHDEKAAGDEWHPASGSLGDDEGSAEVGSGMELTPEDASGQEASVESQHGERNQVFTPPEHQGPRRVSNERATPDISDDSELRPKLILPTATFEVSEIEDNESSFHTQEVDKRQPEREVKVRFVIFGVVADSHAFLLIRSARLKRTPLANKRSQRRPVAIFPTTLTTVRTTLRTTMRTTSAFPT